MRRKVFKPPMVKGVTPDMRFDYKDAVTLRRFVTSRGKIMPRSRTGLTAKQQRELKTSIKRARMLALLPFAY